jgi:hypothetical protein
MTDSDLRQMISRCLGEIKQLRTANAELAPKAHAYDTIAIHARLLEPKVNQVYGEDIVWKLEQELSKIKETVR